MLLMRYVIGEAHLELSKMCWVEGFEYLFGTTIKKIINK
jgi:hypothetical protein